MKGIPSIITHSAVNRPTRKVIILELIKSLMGHSMHTTMPLLVELMIEMNAFLSDEQHEKLRTDVKNLKTDLIVS